MADTSDVQTAHAQEKALGSGSSATAADAAGAEKTEERSAQHVGGAGKMRKPVWLRVFGHDITAPFLLLFLSLMLFVPGQWTIPPLDRDEPRFTQATKQMLETDDYIDIRFQEEARHKKPVGIYWLQAAAVKLTGHGPDAPLWVYRLPSLIGAVICVLASFWLARAFMGPAGALLAGSFVALAIITGVEARLAKTDAMLFATIIIAQGALARVWLKDPERRLWRLSFLFWTALAASVLIKGPVGPMVVGLTVAGLMVFSRRAAWFKGASPLLGAIWFVLLVSPWFVAIWIATDGTFFTESIGKDLLGKVGQGQEGHGAPPLTHLGAMLGIFWPLPAFFLVTLPLIWRERSSPVVVFSAAWFLPSWIVFELVATKLPHYTMPLLPALALPVAAALLDGAGTHTRTWISLDCGDPAGTACHRPGRGRFRRAGLPGCVAVAPGVVIMALGAVFAIGAASRVLRGRAIHAFPAVILTAICVAVGFWGFVGPALTPIWVSPRLIQAIDEIPGCADRQTREVVTSGFHEPSFIFLEGTRTRIISPKGAAEFLAQFTGDDPGICRVAAVESREEPAFLAAAKEIGLVPEARKRVDGLNINGGDKVDIALYQNARVGTSAEDGNEEQQ
ncbi:ArnT family glycosyltransferase [Roseibium salinum]|uniref:Glycosyltransferase family 39 protein n=1 Tax=Roseibium salinum TaxID=1604349 RepID=A0ABT3R113_9HYPH|nr:glycosyltransferase family 39 protein [Roseibium sp. DSM 29163]MCX2722898.1 glycosyltransferase family 39 protein [Roseibium sp. DSM 29163]